MQLILHMAMALRGHVVPDPGRNGRRFVRQIGFIIRLLNKRLAHQIPRASCNAAIGSYLILVLPTRSPGEGTMVLNTSFVPNSVVERPPIRNPFPPRQILLGFYRCRRKPPKPWRNVT